VVEWFVYRSGKKMIGNFFSTPIYMGSILDRRLIDSEINQAVDKATFANKWQPDNDTATTTFDPQGSTDIINDFDMKELESHIVNHAKLYMKEIEHPYKEESLNIFTSWLNIFDKEQVIGLHEHGYQPNTFSGCYYHKVPKNSGDIQFKGATPFVISFPHKAEKYSNIVTVEPTVGMILLFPSWLMHKVLPNRSNETRVSLAFNIEFDYKDY
jgi:uncharacterized protein (TIGR02466 family)